MVFAATDVALLTDAHHWVVSATAAPARARNIQLASRGLVTRSRLVDLSTGAVFCSPCFGWHSVEGHSGTHAPQIGGGLLCWRRTMDRNEPRDQVCFHSRAAATIGLTRRSLGKSILDWMANDVWPSSSIH